MIVRSANLGRRYGGRQEFARRVDDLVRGNRSDGVGFQEIDEADPADELTQLRHVYAGRSWATAPRVPIVAPPSWTVVSTHRVLGAKGVKNLGPHRYINEAILAHRHSRTLPRFVWINTHQHRNVPRLAFKRLQFWLKLSRRIMAYRRRGYTVLLTLDANAQRLPRLAPRQRVLARSGIDYIAAFPKKRGLQLTVTAAGSTPIGIDGHRSPWVRLKVDPPNQD